jgi:hypothetical protein
MELDTYEAPTITELGSVEHFTQGAYGQGSADRIFIFDNPFRS